MTSHSEFGFTTDAATAAAAFPNAIKGKVIMVTGANFQGIGRTTATALAAQGPKLLILTGRSEARVQEVIQAVKETNASVECRFLQLDLSSQKSVRKAAAEVLQYEEDIDILINNAGVMAIAQRQMSPEGIEMQFATNHIGHFLFTNLILDKLRAAAKRNSPGATRIVNVSSLGHMFGPVRFSDYNFEKEASELPEDEQPNIERIKTLGLEAPQGTDSSAAGYIPFVAYGQSKSANVLFSLSLTQKLAPSGIKSFALHPGSIQTELVRHMDEDQLEKLAEARKKNAGANNVVTRKTLEQGSSTTIVAALDPALKADGSNVYLSDCQLVDAADWAVSSIAADKLWQLSEKLVGQTFTLA